MDTITLAESSRLIELEKVVEQNLAAFMSVGEALAEIRDSRLYRVEFNTFEAYVHGKWNMSIRHADRLMVGAKAVANVKQTGPIGPVPKTESQARPLTRLPAEQQPGAWAKAVEIAGGDQPTAKQVEEAVIEILPREEPAPDAPHQGMEIATKAIRILERIATNDTERKRALAHVKHWISLHS